MTDQAKPILDHLSLLGEGPIWDERAHVLYWVDILRGELHAYNPGDGSVETRGFGQFTGAIIPREDGGFVVAAKDGLYFWEENGEKMQIASPEAGLPNNRFNDAKCDSMGRLWAGTMAMDGSPNRGALYRLEEGKPLTKMVEGVGCSNGLAWSSDHRRMFYIDTPTRQVIAYDFDVASGDIANPRVVVEITEGVPDGMTIDENDNLWVAHWGGWKVSGWNPEIGRCVGEIRLPVSLVTSCTFGGDDRRTLFITSARTDLSHEQLAAEPLAGSVFSLEMQVCGQSLMRYKR